VDWTLKAKIQRAFSSLPAGHRLNYLMQRHVTRSLPRSPEALREIIATAEAHLAAIARHDPRPPAELRFFEFGAGYDLAEPLATAALGVRHRRLYDIRPVARPAMVRHAAGQLRALGLDLLAPPDRGPIQGYLAEVGIDYVAPGDARATGLEAGSIDAATSTSVLEHIGPDDLAAILRELRRILAPGGLCSFAVDYHDHFAGADPAIDGLHFLRFTDAEWERFNSDLQFQNRLRHDDYVAMFEAAGFELVEVRPIVDPAFPAEPVVAERFAGRSDLAIGDGWFVLRNPGGPDPAP
jgi:SAM-dependent methyltransferase